MTKPTLRSIVEITQMTKRILGRNHDYEAVAASIWLEAWENIGCPPEQELVPASWGFVTNRCRDLIRHQKMEARVNEKRSFSTEQAETVDNNNIDPELFGLLMDRAHLSMQQQEILLRCYVYKQSDNIIATALDVPKRGVRKLRLLAVEELKRIERSR